MAQMIKNLPAMPETQVCSLNWEDPPEKGIATLSMENPMDRRAWWAKIHGVAKSWTRLSN